MEVLVATLGAPVKSTVIGSPKSILRNFGCSSLQLLLSPGLIVCMVVGFAIALVSTPGGVLAGRPRLTWGVANPLPLPCGFRDNCPVAIGTFAIALGVWPTAALGVWPAAGSCTAVLAGIDVAGWTDILLSESDSVTGRSDMASQVAVSDIRH